MTNTAERTVWLIRHAKAADSDPGQEDIDRRLAHRGERQCEAMRDWLGKRVQGTENITVLVSPAERAQRTAELALDGFPAEPREDARIWNATAAALAALIEETEGNLVLVGHNPGLERVQFALTGHLMPMPTGGMFELEFGSQGRVRLAASFQPETDST